MGDITQALRSAQSGLLANQQTHDGILAGRSYDELLVGYQRPLREFLQARANFLLY